MLELGFFLVDVLDGFARARRSGRRRRRDDRVAAVAEGLRLRGPRGFLRRGGFLGLRSRRAIRTAWGAGDGARGVRFGARCDARRDAAATAVADAFQIRRARRGWRRALGTAGAFSPISTISDMVRCEEGGSSREARERSVRGRVVRWRDARAWECARDVFFPPRRFLSRFAASGDPRSNAG